MIETKNFTTPFINIQINSQFFANHSKTVHNLTNMILHAKKMNEKIEYNWYWFDLRLPSTPLLITFIIIVCIVLILFLIKFFI